MLAMPPCRPHKSSYSPMSLVTRGRPLDLAMHHMRVAAAEPRNSSLDDTRQSRLGEEARQRAATLVSTVSIRKGAVSAFFSRQRQQSVRAAVGPPGLCLCHDSHADTWTPHFSPSTEKHRAGWTSRSTIFVSASVCALRGECTCARERERARKGTVLDGQACIER